MEFLTVILAVSPIIIVVICVLFLRLPADYSGLIGFLTALLVSMLYFHTDAIVTAKSVLAGIIESLPITLLVAASMLQVFFMEQTGAIKRIAVALKTLGGGDKIATAIVLNIGVAAILWGVGLNPLSILPLLLISLGFSSYAAVALPAVGSAALFIYAFLGAPLDVFHFYAQGAQTFSQAGGYFPYYILPATLVTCLGVLYIAGGWKAVARGFSSTVIVSAAAYLVSIIAVRFGLVHWTGLISGISIVALILLWRKVRGRSNSEAVTLKDEKVSERNIPLILALLPLILTAVLFLLTRSLEPVRYFVVETASGPVNIVPAHVIRTVPLSQPYLLTLIAVLLAIPFHRSGWKHFKEAGRKFTRLGLRPVLAATLFFASAYVMWYSGLEPGINGFGVMGWIYAENGGNMIRVMVLFCEQAFDRLYAIPGTIAGLRMGFISGSETLPVEMLTRANIEAAGIHIRPGGAGLYIAAASAVAASFMVMFNPARLQNASAVIGQTGIESRVWRTTAVITVIGVAVTACIAYLLSTL